MPLTTLTAWEALFDRMGVPLPAAAGSRPAATLLVIAGAGGVGSIAIQIAKRVAGLRVIATASRPETEAWCREMGARSAAPLSSETLREAHAQIESGRTIGKLVLSVL